MAHGRQPRLGMELTRLHSDKKVQGANEMVEKMKRVTAETEVALNAVAEDMKQYYDTRHWPHEFQIGDKVWLNAKDLTTEQPSKKLDYKQLGPFKILRKIDDLAYELKLPALFKIHPVISVSQLEPVKHDEWQRPQPHVTLKVRDPQTKEFINHVETSRSVFRVNDDDLARMWFRLHPERYPNMSIERAKLNEDVQL
jgi:hypothetical protein